MDVGDRGYLIAPGNSEIKERFAKAGWFVRHTQWFEGHQVCVVWPRDTRKCVVSAWRPSEAEAWESIVPEVEKREAEIKASVEQVKE